MIPAPATFDEEVAFLGKHSEVIVLEAPGGGRIAVSPTYQARVMTSAVGPSAASLGWVHRAFIASGKRGTAWDNYGGEDRFWLGPEGGQFGLYFPPGSAFSFDTWQTPHELQEGAWQVVARTDAEVTFHRRMHVTNWSGTAFDVAVERRVRVLGPDAAARHVATPGAAQLVAYETENTITNAGSAAWTEEGGLLSIWVLGMYTPAGDAHIVVPFDPAGSGPAVNDAYFGKVPPDRLRVRDGYLVLKADGEQRGKIGVPAGRARAIAASYAASLKLLTVVHFDRPPGANRYVNSMWEKQSEPYGGDVVNSYNDGPVAPGKPSLGGFYELEASSPAAALAPGASMVHTQRTFHFVGEPAALDPIATKAVGIPTAQFRIGE